MTLGEVTCGGFAEAGDPPELAGVDVGGLEYDSRRVGEGFLFFAFPGSRADGRQFAEDALARGAVG